ncbi:uncharacterized protein LOC135834853 [Planococcus citri]|uniref:uncharacterized protein LOC135834853 n=1 Tax=Planococcus citri TaxID=170843 RepID=UPI0031F973BB
MLRVHLLVSILCSFLCLNFLKRIPYILSDSTNTHVGRWRDKPSKVNPAEQRIFLGLEMTDFLELRYYNDIVIDRSLLILEFLEEYSQTFLITRPRQFGKSINLDMLRRFFELELDPKGFPFSRQNKVNYRFFCGGSVMNLKREKKSLGPMKVCYLESVMMEQGYYPTITINFHNVSGYDYDHVVNTLWYEVFKSHYYLRDYCTMNLTDGVEDTDKERIWRYFYDEQFRKANIKMSLYFLTKILYQRFKRKVFVFIDEYDTPLLFTHLDFRENNRTQDLPRVHELMHDLFENAFVNNPFLRTAVITGTLVVRNAYIFDNFTNFHHYSILDERFAGYFGLTQTEIREMLNKIPPIKTSLKLILSYYGAYNFAGVEIFNPYSILKCVHKDRIGRYWIKEDQPVDMKHAFLNDIKQLAAGESIVSKIYQEVDFDDLDRPENVFSLLLYTGYLTVVKKIAHMTYEIKPPNEEVKQMFQMVERKILKNEKIKPTTGGAITYAVKSYTAGMFCDPQG